MPQMTRPQYLSIKELFIGKAPADLIDARFILTKVHDLQSITARFKAVFFQYILRQIFSDHACITLKSVMDNAPHSLLREARSQRIDGQELARLPKVQLFIIALKDFKIWMHQLKLSIKSRDHAAEPDLAPWDEALQIATRIFEPFTDYADIAVIHSEIEHLLAFGGVLLVYPRDICSQGNHISFFQLSKTRIDSSADIEPRE